MKKTLITILLLVQFSFLFGQSLLKYKTSIEYKNRTSTFLSEGSRLKNLIGNGELIINYRLDRKISMGVIGGIGTHIFNKTYSFFDESGVQKKHEYELQFNKKTIGAQLNYYFRGNVAPIGSSFGLFYVFDDYIVDDYSEFYAYLQRNGSDDFVTDEKIDYIIQYVGAELNYVAMLSQKYAIYFKYGASFAIPIHSQIVDYTQSELGFDRYSSLNSNYQDYDFLSNFKINRILTLNLGIGFLIR